MINNKTAIIIQARMNSSRLPGKVMIEVGGKPLIGHLLDRIKMLKNIDAIIVATTCDSVNNMMCEYLMQRGVKIFRGSEDDVLERFYLAAKEYDINNIIRLTADCPLIDPKIIEMQIKYYEENKCDYVYLGLTYAEGICSDMFSFHALETAYKNAKESAEREHVTPYLHKHPELFKIKVLENETDDSKYRFVVDRPEDFEVVKSIICNLFNNKSTSYDVKNIKQYLDDNPAIYKINAQVIRNESYNVFDKG